MRRTIGVIVSVIGLSVLLSGCGKSAKDQFVQAYKEQITQKEGTWTFEGGIKEIEFGSSSDTAVNPTIGMLQTQLKDISIKGTYQIVKKEDYMFDVSMKAKALGMEIPVEMIGSLGKQPKVYLGTDMLEYLTQVLATISGGATVTEGFDTEEYKGKYVDLTALGEEIDKEEQDKVRKEYKVMEKEQMKNREKVSDYLNELDQKTFTQKDGAVSHTFTKKELEKLISIFINEAEEKKTMKEMLKQYQDLSVKVSIDTKKKKTSSVWTIKQAEEEAESSIQSMVVESSVTYSEKKPTIDLPKKEAILSEEKVNEMFKQIEGTSETTTGVLTEKEFNELKKTLEEVKDSLDKETKEDLLTSYQEMLTEEQLKEVKELLQDVGEPNL